MKYYLPLLLSTLPVGAHAQQAAPGQATLIQNVSIFDGEKSLGTASILIADGKIVNPSHKGKAPKGARIVDGSGKTLLPGFIDSHVHAFEGLDTPLLFGVTTQLDMFMPPAAIQQLRDVAKNGNDGKMADLYSAGFLATVPGGHGTQFGISVPTLTTPAEADGWVAARVAEGSDYIKIVNEPGSSFGTTLPTLESATIRALIQAAHKRGKLAVVHVQNLDTAVDAINSGADGLVHLFADKEGGAEFAKLARAKGVFITPTYTVMESFAGRSGGGELLKHPGLSGLLPSPAMDGLKQSLGPDRSAALDAMQAKNISALVKANVPILAGTDSGNPGTHYGISMHRELELLVKAGMTPSQALSAATANPARAYRLTDRGRIAKGLKADLLLVNGDPTKNIAATRDIVEIWKNGSSANSLREARRAELLKVASQTKAAAALPKDGLIATFTPAAGDVDIKSPFGLGWSKNTDAIMGGGSNITLSMAANGPNGQPALNLKGEVKKGAFAQWAGIAFNPADKPFAPANISAATALTFRIKGEAGGFGVMAFSEKSGTRPIVAQIPLTKDWTQITVKFSDMAGFDPSAATMLLIGAIQPGAYSFDVADIRLVQ